MWARRVFRRLWHGLRGTAKEILLVDLNTKLSQAQAEDILHATPFYHPVRVAAGDYPQLEGCGVVILACGVGQRPGETRLHLLARNVEVFRQVVPQVLRFVPAAVLLVVSNPVDVITRVGTKLAGIAHIVQAIRDDARRVLTVSNFTVGVEEFKGICLSLPRVVGSKGILAELRPELSKEEHPALQRSADILKEAAASINMM